MVYENLKIGETIKRLRIKKNMDVFELAYQADISMSHVYQLETGATKMSIDLLFRLMDSLGTDANTILGVKPNSESIDDEIKSLTPEAREKLIPLFKTMIEQVKAISN